MGNSAALNFADGKTFFINVNDNELLLDAAFRQGITLPLDCREGVCATCKGRCDSGEYEQDYVDEDALTEDELNQRNILACQTRLRSNATFYFDYPSDFCNATQLSKIQAKVTEIEWISDETVNLRLDASQNIGLLNFLPGQYARIYLPDTGEYRAYSFAHTPTKDNQLQFLIRYLADGVMGKYLKQQCQIGDTLDLELPFGSFYLREVKESIPLYLVAGGTGVSAILAMLDELKNQAYSAPIYFYYGVRDKAHLCEQDRIEAYKASLPGLEYYPVISLPDDEWQGLTGFIHDHLPLSALEQQENDMYVCGPPVLIDSLKQHLSKNNINTVQLYSEKFLSATSPLEAA